jgi:hypothetical protein
METPCLPSLSSRARLADRESKIEALHLRFSHSWESEVFVGRYRDEVKRRREGEGEAESRLIR